VTALGGYAMTAITALTAQNTQGVQSVLSVEPAFIREQIISVLEDIGADVIKTGMLHDPEVIDIVAETLAEYGADIPLVVDPVMVAQSGHQLVSETAMQRLSQRLLKQAALITPNLPEAQALLGYPIESAAAMPAAAKALCDWGCKAVLLKGGHLAGDQLVDVLASAQHYIELPQSRVPTTSDHGTGCTLASAIAEGIGRGLSTEEAVKRGRAYLRRALETATPLGQGHGPVNHGHTVGIMTS